MNIPGYDAWKLSGPDDDRDEPDLCDYCDSHCPATGYWRCPECDAEWNEGQGEPNPVEAEEPDGDYEYERRRDAIGDRG